MTASCITQSRLIVAISSRALFDLDEANTIFESEGREAYYRYQIDHENDVLAPGYGFQLVQKLLHINTLFPTDNLIEVILLSRNSGQTGLRIFNSIQHHNLDIRRAAFTSGESAHRYIPAFACDLFLSANPDDVKQAIDAGYAAATILSPSTSLDRKMIRIAFDGDSVLWGDESERLFMESGLSVFVQHERDKARDPLPKGPLVAFAKKLSDIQAHFFVNLADNCPIRTALVTSRASPAHERAIHTMRSLGLELDHTLFLGGRGKGPFLSAFGADIFFDDMHQNCLSASNHRVSAAHVPNGCRNVESDPKKLLQEI